ncbi:MAG: PilW family protein [Candidatus Thiodiazotropha sp. 6PLUC2]
MKATPGNQSGFSIVSLMIASAIGIFLIGGAGKVYVDSKNTFNARSSVAAAVENYRFALLDMRRALVMAGRGILASQNGNLATGPFPGVATDGAEDTDSNGSSVVAVRYASGPAPCGISGDVTATITVRFLVDDDGNLVCNVPEQDYSQPLVSGIAQMRALYGVDTDADGVANQYLRTNVVDDGGLWINVVSIRIGLVTGSGEGQDLPVAYRPATPEPKNMLGDEYTPTDTSKAYKSASTTIAFRNLNQTMNRQ